MDAGLCLLEIRHGIIKGVKYHCACSSQRNTESSGCNLAYKHHAVGITLKPVYLFLAILSRTINTRIADVLFLQQPAYSMNFRDKPCYDNQLMSFLNTAFKDIFKSFQLGITDLLDFPTVIASDEAAG